MIIPPPLDEAILTIVRSAIREDLGGLPGEAAAIDRTTKIAILPTAVGKAHIAARKSGVFCGGFLLPVILKMFGGSLGFRVDIPDGQLVNAGQQIAEIRGPLANMLSAERTVLNFLSHLSGIASLTHKFVMAVARCRPGSPPLICDTRKTTPGWRSLEKYAVRCGGAVSHRMGLFDGVMLKDNHIAALRSGTDAARSLAQITARIRRELPPEIKLWIEVDNLDQLKEAIPGGAADIILLDNMTPAMLTQAVALRNELGRGGKPLLEASGGITLENVADIGRTGVDRISIGALTHSAPALDLALDLS